MLACWSRVGLGVFCSKFALLCYAAIPKGCSIMLKSSFIMLKSSSGLPNLSSIILIVSLVDYHKNVLSYEIDLLKWWERNEVKLPFWSNACKKVLLCQPSSASVEQVLSLLKQFTEQQQTRLEDYIKTALMIQYNSKLMICFLHTILNF